MTIYKNLNGTSGISHYENGDDYIKVKFKNEIHTLYLYTYVSASKETINDMQKLAIQGKDLNSYISKNKPPYASKR